MAARKYELSLPFAAFTRVFTQPLYWRTFALHLCYICRQAQGVSLGLALYKQAGKAICDSSLQICTLTIKMLRNIIGNSIGTAQRAQ